MDDCVFCKIAKREMQSEVVFEDKDVLAFKDNKPSADTHLLIIPKKHIPSFVDIKKNDSETVNQMIEVAQKLASEFEITGKYKLIINGGEYQFVPHLHLHLLGGNIRKEV